MSDLERLLDLYAVNVRFADLGDWGNAELRAEYDPDGPEIRVNERLARELVPFAIAHELYHHQEAIGEIATLPDREARETAADAFACELLAGAP
jgi:Zn-dependent peptidase ImmA (M78 family)